MARARKPPRSTVLSTALRTAQSDAAVAYGPQISADLQIAGGVNQQYVQELAAAKAAANVLTSGIRGQMPKVAKDYAHLGLVQKGTQDFLAPHLASLGPGAADIAAASAREGAGQATRIATEGLNATNEYRSRLHDANAARLYGVQAAQARHSIDLGKVNQQITDTLRQQGQFTVSDAAKIAQAERQAGLTRRGQNFTLQAAKARTATTVRGQNLSHQDRQAGLAARAAAAAAKAKNAKNSVTATQSGHAVDQINLATKWIGRLTQARWSSSQIRDALETGSATVQAPDATGKLIQIKVPHISGAGRIAGHDLVNAAYDVHAFGTLSHPNRVALRGAHLPAQWKRPIPRRSPVAVPGLPAVR